MRLLGAKNIGELGPRFVSLPEQSHSQTRSCCRTLRLTRCQVNARMVERDIYDGEPNLDQSGLWEKSAVLKSRL